MRRRTRIPPAAAGLVYAVFAVACFRLAIEHGYERGVSLGEGSFALLGAAGLLAAATRAKSRALIAAAATLPLVGWFLATPWNSGPPFLLASLVAPSIACLGLARAALVRTERV